MRSGSSAPTPGRTCASRWPTRDASSFDARFDLLVSFNALHWVPQQADALRGIRRALKPHGQAHLRLVTRAALTSLEEVAEAVRQEPHWAAAFAGFSDPYLRLGAAEYVALADEPGTEAAVQPERDRSAGTSGPKRPSSASATPASAPGRRCCRRRGAATFVEEVMQRYLAVIDAAFGERYTFHFMQTDVVLALPKPAEADQNSGAKPLLAWLRGEHRFDAALQRVALGADSPGAAMPRRPRRAAATGRPARRHGGSGSEAIQRAGRAGLRWPAGRSASG